MIFAQIFLYKIYNINAIQTVSLEEIAATASKLDKLAEKLKESLKF